MNLVFLSVVQCTLEDVQINGGGLNGTYSTTQFHLHWGDTEHHPGSEHTIDGERYPMEVSSIDVSFYLPCDLPCFFLSVHLISCRCMLSV